MQGVMALYDITDHESFVDAVKWMYEASKNTGKDTVRVLVGNKCDLHRHRQVSFSEGKELADQLGVKFLETSAKTSQNVEQLFQVVAREAARRKGRSHS